MSPRKKTILITIAVVIFTLVGCSSGTTPTPTPTGLLGIRKETEDPNVGWATIVYKWEDNQPPAWNVSVDVEINVIIDQNDLTFFIRQIQPTGGVRDHKFLGA